MHSFGLDSKITTHRTLVRAPIESYAIENLDHIFRDQAGLEAFGTTVEKVSNIVKNRSDILRAQGEGNIFWKGWITQKSNNDVIGLLSLSTYFVPEKTCDIGYYVSEQYRRKGFMREVIEGIKSSALDVLGCNTLQAMVHEDNKASIRLLEQTGFKFGGYRREENGLFGRYSVNV